MIDGGYMNDKNIFYKKNVSLSILIILLGLLVISGTFAYLMSVSINVTDGNYSTTLECFDIEYSNDGHITGILFPSSTFLGGLSGSIGLGISSDCNVTGIGKLKLVVESANSILTSIVNGHCENYSTLQTIVNSDGSLVDEATCKSKSGYKWVTNGTALKYAVLEGDLLISVGYIDGIDSFTKLIYDDFDVSNSVTYTIYIWLDGNISDNSYENLSFNGQISSSVVQVEKVR